MYHFRGQLRICVFDMPFYDCCSLPMMLIFSNNNTQYTVPIFNNYLNSIYMNLTLNFHFPDTSILHFILLFLNLLDSGGEFAMA